MSPPARHAPVVVRPAATAAPVVPATPLHEVTFCVVDLETTGGSPAACAITEVGAAKFRGGECIGTFQTLVNPGVPVPPEITLMTGITEAMIGPAPPPDAVLPTLLEFIGRSVLVGHNLRFDVSFLDAALASSERDRLDLAMVDTMALARRLVRDDVDDCRLGTLAERFCLAHRPTHRALDDVLATADLLHVLLERAAGFGATALDDLLTLPHLAGHPHAVKLRLTTPLPRAPGVYALRDAQGRVTHVGRARNLRAEVRAAFSRERGRVPGSLLRTVQRLDYEVCTSGLHAAVVASRTADAVIPRRAARVRRYHYVKLLTGRAPRLAVARTPSAQRARSLGPLPSASMARAVVDAVGSVVGPDDLAAATSVHALVDTALRILRAEGGGGRGERRRAGHAVTVLAAAVRRQSRADQLRRAERLVLALPGDACVEIRRGRLVNAWSGPSPPPARACAPAFLPLHAVVLPPADRPLPREMAAEVAQVGAWLDRNAHRLRLLAVEGELSSPWPGPQPASSPGRTRPPPVAVAATSPGLRCSTCSPPSC
ncbi:MAG TPA: exonuclease domain-containing protein [Acidimicrobiales bacterium]|nr:exonuclease domain-containing protein [Acidimicrobiales bacterium]